jgi:hypothetical protein
MSSWAGQQLLNALDIRATGINPRLLDILHSKIKQFMVEFLVIGEADDGVVKPHVIFHLLLNPYNQNQEFTACRLSMEYEALGPTRDGGALTITGSNYQGSHRKATGSFGFVLTSAGKETTAKTLLNIILGRHSSQRQLGPLHGDLSQFDFNELQVAARTQSQMDGCRDWIAQAFTRFYLLGLITMCGQELQQTPALYEGQQVTYLNFNQHIPSRSATIQPAPFWFPDIIDKKFIMTPTAQHPTGVTIQPIKMWRGRFHDRTVTRQETVNVYNNNRSEHFTFCYNYTDSSRPSSAGGPSSGQPPSRGGGNGQTGTGSTPAGGASTAERGQPSWVSVMVSGKEKGVRDANARPDKNGWVPVYDRKKNAKGHYHLLQKVYKA